MSKPATITTSSQARRRSDPTCYEIRMDGADRCPLTCTRRNAPPVPGYRCDLDAYIKPEGLCPVVIDGSTRAPSLDGYEGACEMRCDGDKEDRTW